jgi:hypothetical protein
MHHALESDIVEGIGEGWCGKSRQRFHHIV